MSAPPHDPARRAAAALVSAVTDEGRTLDAALTQTRSFAALTGRDRAFARAIASATLRRLGGVDAVLNAFIATPLRDEARVARAILRTAAAQILAMETPPHAAVSAAVDLARASSSAMPFAGLINAVLRRVDREGRDAFAALEPGSDLPDWLFARWRATYGDAAAAAIAAAILEEPPLDLTVRSEPETWAERLDAKLAPTGSLRLPPRADVPALPGFAEGAWWVQDAAAALPARLLGDVAGKRVLDLCAAPGGKTLQLAAAGAQVTALDVDAERLERVSDNLVRTGLTAEIVCADVLAFTPDTLFDAILLDAPCTATGTLRRHPDVAWLRRPSDITSLSALQAQMLRRAAAWVAPGGTLVYAVCSLEPEEGPGVAATLVDDGLTRTPIAADETGGLSELIDADGALRTLPCHLGAAGGMDGFYAARWRR
jgi:16S rRNA (cytosine967-C5)-methyltransferase